MLSSVEEFWAWVVTVNWWQVVVDAAIPVASILIPSLIVLRLAKRERRAQDAAVQRRIEAETAASERAAWDRRRRGIDQALAAAGDLLEAAFVPDRGATPNPEVVRLHIRSGQRLGAIAMDLSPESGPVLSWIISELKIIAGAVKDRDDEGLPRARDKISWRIGRFSNDLAVWIAGERTTESFQNTQHVPIEETSNPQVQSATDISR